MASQYIINCFEKLLKNRSDCGTEFEAGFEDLLLEILNEQVYFQGNPDKFGKMKIENDKLGRSCVWAFVDNGAKDTVLLFGHFDTVGIERYGDLQRYAFDSDALKEKFSDVEEDLENWIFGRGSCDMKAGIAINFELLRRSAEDINFPNILFLAVPDEEGLSSGMRGALPLLKEIEKRYNISYHSAFLTEPHERTSKDEFVTYSGSAGKMMPLIVAKGIPVHTGDVYSGLNPVGILMEIIKAIELNTEMGDVVYKRMTPPPTFLCIRDLKEVYDVTTPEYAGAFFNWMFLKDHFDQKLNRLKELCVWSFEDAINQFNYSYNEFLRKQGHPSYQTVKEFNAEVLLFTELVERLNKKTDANKFIDLFFNDNPYENDQILTAKLIKAIVEFLEIQNPIVVIALLSPFYPAVDGFDFYRQTFEGIVSNKCREFGMNLKSEPFFMKICDMSYLKASKSNFEPIKENMPLLNRRYSLDFDALNEMDIPCSILGPWGKDLHQKTERVYKPDLVKHVPEMLEELLLEIKKCSN